VGFGCSRHRYGLLRSEAQFAGAEKLHADLDAVRSPIGCRGRETNAKFRRVLVCQRDHALGAAGKRDGVLQSAFARGIKDRIDRPCKRKAPFPGPL